MPSRLIAQSDTGEGYLGKVVAGRIASFIDDQLASTGGREYEGVGCCLATVQLGFSTHNGGGYMPEDIAFLGISL